MLRDKLLKPSASKRGSYFVWRNHEVLRIEAFSDAVFAFAVTLVIVSLEVPVTFHELLESMRGMIGFSISFLFLFMIWHRQYLFFRYFGMRDRTTIILNAVLIFTVLFYVYPLKFLFQLLTVGNIAMEHGEKVLRVQNIDEVRELMEIYSVGFIAVYLTFTLMYAHAWKKRVELHLSKIELFHLKTHIYMNITLMSVGLLCLLASEFLPDDTVGASGIIFSIIAPVLTVLGSFRRKRFTKHTSHDEREMHLHAVAISKKSLKAVHDN